jgi:phospho-N-acetylmuramoyl-pentapeptide-transferase
LFKIFARQSNPKARIISGDQGSGVRGPDVAAASLNEERINTETIIRHMPTTPSTGQARVVPNRPPGLTSSLALIAASLCETLAYRENVITVLSAAAVALVVTLFGTPLFVRLLAGLGWSGTRGKPGRQGRPDISAPTAGGAMLVVGSGLGYFSGHLIAGATFTAAALLILAFFVICGSVGFVDDYLQRRASRRRSRLGLVVALLFAAATFAVVAANIRDGHGTTIASHYVSAIRDISWLNLYALGPILGLLLVAILTSGLVTGSAFAVKATDGLDGLAAGASLFTAAAYLVIGFWQNNESCFGGRRLEESFAYKCYLVRDPHDIAVLGAAVVGSPIGFLWWNTSPAQIRLGSTGSIGLGGMFAAFSIVTRTEILLVLLGGLFVVVAGSIGAQRIYFQATRGRRLFLATPIHRHLELKGWTQIRVVGRLWLIAALLASTGVGLFYLEWAAR